MAAFRITLLAIMIGAGANSAAGYRSFGFAAAPIINYGPSLPGWPSSNPIADRPFFNPIVIPTPVIPTADEIINTMGKPGVNFEGFTFTSNGGGATIISNKNGEVKTFKVGGEPPNADETLKPEFEPTIVENEDGTGFSSSHSGGFTSFTSTSSVNGKGVTVGGVTTSVNNNGKTKQQTTYFDSRDK